MALAINVNQEYRFKVIVIGSMGAGKTSIISRFVRNDFSDNYQSTVGVDFGHKIIEKDRNTKVHLQIWDVAGQERFGSVTTHYYRGAVGALLVFDITNETSWNAIFKWKNDLDSKLDKAIPILLLANKSDLVRDPSDMIVPDSVIDDWVKANRANGVVGWLKTSALKNENITLAMNKMVDSIFSVVINNDSCQPEEEMQTTKTVVIDRRNDGIPVNNDCGCNVL